MWEIWRSRTAVNSLHRSGRADGTQSPVDTGTPLGRIASGTVTFKDVSIRPEVLDAADGEDDSDDRHSEDSTNKSAILLRALKRPDRTKYVIILVGLPGRGKTFLCNKIKCYLNWLGHHTRHFNVGSYRRLQKGDQEVQTADFFDAHNAVGLEARNRALYAALEDLKGYLYSPEGQVAIFDATNTTEERRRLLIREFHGHFQYLFIESICTDDKVLEQNYRFKMQYSPDYRGMDMQQSLNDFKARIHKYEEVYEAITDRNIHYIKLIDMVTGRGHMDVNRISGYLPGKIVFFLMQVCKAGMAQARRIWLTRHGESEFNLSQRIGGNSGLAPSGEVYARCLPDMLIDRLPQASDEQDCVPVSVWTSTLCRTIQTARYLPFPKLRWKALDEIQAGTCDGMTYEEIAERYPEEYEARQLDKLRYRYPAGESYMDVIQRLEPVIIEMEREKECIVVVGHQAVLRAILGYFMARPLESIPTLNVPLHTLVELRPRPDGTMDFDYFPMPREAAAAAEAVIAAASASGVGGASGYGIACNSDSLSGAASPILSPMYSMGRRHDVVAPTLPVGTAAALAATTAWSALKLHKAPVRTSAEAAEATAGTVAAEATPSAGVAEAEAVGVEAAAVDAEAVVVEQDAGPAGFANSPGQKHSRHPSLGSGIAGASGGGSVIGSYGSSPASGFLFSVAAGSGSPGAAVDSPKALAAAAALDAGRTRPVRVPFGATMGGGGSEGGAPPDVHLGAAAALAAAQRYSLNPYPTPHSAQSSPSSQTHERQGSPEQHSHPNPYAHPHVQQSHPYQLSRLQPSEGIVSNVVHAPERVDELPVSREPSAAVEVREASLAYLLATAATLASMDSPRDSPRVIGGDDGGRELRCGSGGDESALSASGSGADRGGGGGGCSDCVLGGVAGGAAVIDAKLEAAGGEVATGAGGAD